MTLEEVKNYLHIDFDDEDNLLNSFITQSQIYIDSMVGTGYKSNEDAVQLKNVLQLKLISDMYENRGSNTEGANNLKRDIIVTSILDKLSLYEGDSSE